VIGRAALAMALLLFTAAPSFAQNVRIDTGELVGRSANGVETFLGIPYAAPPVGALRWRAPQRALAWDGMRRADALGADCVQDGRPAANTHPMSEDCLTINVWRPAGARARARLPVIVWIHGGAYVAGGSSDAQTYGESFARRGVILVTFNYRLGRLGFFAHPALSREQQGEPLGNYGTLDQIAALQWVRRNIDRFGGDPERVTAMGQSAGGESVLILAGSPMAAGLFFQRAIVQSGGGRAPLLGRRLMREDLPQRVSAEHAGLAFARSIGVEGEDEAALEQLRALPAERVNAGLTMVSLLFGGLATFTGPIEDGRVITASPDAALSARDRAIPILIGTTTADLGLNRAQTKDAALAAFGASSEAARAAYDQSGATPLAAINAAIGADRTMNEPARRVARLTEGQGAPAWRFRFGYVAEALVNKAIPGAEHTSDVAYAFGTLRAALQETVSEQDASVADMMIRYWINFARRGNPNGAGLPRWEREPAVLAFDADGEVRLGPDPWQTRLDLTEAAREQPR
jgi:para-nitrobenzyl esterase